jgi:hypothetical protein
VLPTMSSLAQQLRNIVLQGTNRGVWNLAVDVLPERVVLRGEADTFYAKQLAQESVLKAFPLVALENAIQVA